MWRWIIIALAALAVVLLLAALLSQLIIRIKYIREEENDEVTATLVALFGLIYIRYRVPAIKLVGMLQGISWKVDKTSSDTTVVEETLTVKEMTEYYKKFRKLIRHMLDYKEWLCDTLGHIHVDKVRWRTRIGLGEAPETAVTTGIIWGIKSSLLSQILRYFKLETSPILSVDPDFNKLSFRTEADLHLHVRLFRLMAAGIMLLVRVIRTEKGLKAWMRILPKQTAE